MATRVTASLPNALLKLLKEGCPALLLTLGADGYPATAFTWVAATNARRVRFGADLGSATLDNLQRERRASLQIIGQGNLLFLIKGTAWQVKPQVDAASMKIALMQMDVTEVKDQSWPGVTVRPLAYEWLSEQRERMLAMERAIYAEMRAWKG